MKLSLKICLVAIIASTMGLVACGEKNNKKNKNAVRAGNEKIIRGDLDEQKQALQVEADIESGKTAEQKEQERVAREKKIAEADATIVSRGDYETIPGLKAAGRVSSDVVTDALDSTARGASKVGQAIESFFTGYSEGEETKAELTVKYEDTKKQKHDAVISLSATPKMSKCEVAKGSNGNLVVTVTLQDIGGLGAQTHTKIVGSFILNPNKTEDSSDVVTNFEIKSFEHKEMVISDVSGTVNFIKDIKLQDAKETVDGSSMVGYFLRSVEAKSMNADEAIQIHASIKSEVTATQKSTKEGEANTVQTLSLDGRIRCAVDKSTAK